MEASPQQPSLTLGDEFVSDDEQVVRLSVHHRGGSVAHGSLRADVVAQGNGGCPECRRAPRFAYCPNFLLGWRTKPSAMTSRPIRKSYGPLCPNCCVDPTSSRSHLTSLCGGTQRTMLVFPTGSATVTRMWRLACPLPLTRQRLWLSSAGGHGRRRGCGARQSAEPVGERLPTTNGA